MFSSFFDCPVGRQYFGGEVVDVLVDLLLGQLFSYLFHVGFNLIFGVGIFYKFS